MLNYLQLLEAHNDQWKAWHWLLCSPCYGGFWQRVFTSLFPLINPTPQDSGAGKALPLSEITLCFLSIRCFIVFFFFPAWQCTFKAASIKLDLTLKLRADVRERFSSLEAEQFKNKLKCPTQFLWWRRSNVSRGIWCHSCFLLWHLNIRIWQGSCTWVLFLWV